MRKLLICIMAILLIMGLMLTSGCKKEESMEGIEIIGAGATFPYPLYVKMFEEYNKLTGVKVNYQGIGSGGGIKQITAKTVDFGASDAFLSDEELENIKRETNGGEIVHIPICLGSVVLTYNLKDVTSLNLTPDLIANIFLGKIKKWNDPAIVAENPDVKLPNLNISVVHRSDGSGTTFVFTDYLTKANKEWAAKVGVGKSVDWPVGLGGKGNPGVQGLVTQVEGSIGYVELIYAIENKMPVASVKNKSGKYITPSLESTTLSAQIDIPADTRVSITDTDAGDGYPISSFTWILVYKEQNYDNRTKSQAKALVKLLKWMVNEGQVIPPTLGYASLPDSAKEKANKLISSMTYGGKVILK
ncbi:MAG TPA: phosphate ABC transporter substrate-binding protein PstS [Spirochaetota bacterium]|nr:phosphate ABC transporter substrate-binding protein PstS [Spirochaetota bacterium]